MFRYSLGLIIALCLWSCTSNGQQKTTVTTTTVKTPLPKLNNDLAEKFYHSTPIINKKVDSIYNQLTVSERAAQLIMIASSETLGYPYATYVKPNVKSGIAANVIFLKGKTSSFKAQENELSAQNMKGLLPLYACDCEPSLFHYKFTDPKPKMTPTSKLGDSLAIVASLDTIHQVMKDLNITLNFAPVVDIAANKAVINNRAWSSEPEKIVSSSKIFINTEQNKSIASTIKHFPGHGAVEGDTHHGKVWINGNLTEVPTFKKVIEQAHPIFVMVGHISIKNNADSLNTPNGDPASISRNIVTNLLKEELKFKGIVTTDAMNMGAIKNIKNADFKAIQAGVDLILMPNNPQVLHQQIVAALEKNDDLSLQIQESVKKIIKLKLLTNRVI